MTFCNIYKRLNITISNILNDFFHRSRKIKTKNNLGEKKWSDDRGIIIQEIHKNI